MPAHERALAVAPRELDRPKEDACNSDVKDLLLALRLLPFIQSSMLMLIFADPS